jgi:hypothetical protein
MRRYRPVRLSVDSYCLHLGGRQRTLSSPDSGDFLEFVSIPRVVLHGGCDPAVSLPASETPIRVDVETPGHLLIMGQRTRATT